MNPEALARFGALGGVIFVGLDGAATLLAGEPPGSSSAAADYFADHGAGLQTGLWLFSLSTIALSWWFASIWLLMTREGGSGTFLAMVSVVGLTIAGALSLASGVVGAAASLHSAEVAETAGFIYSLSYILLATSGFGLVIHILPIVAFGAQSGTLSTWLRGCGIVAALCFAASGIFAAESTSSVAANVGLLGFGVWCVWILGISYTLWNDNSATMRTQRA